MNNIKASTSMLRILFENSQRNFYFLLALFLITILFTYPFLKYPYDMFFHLLQIDNPNEQIIGSRDRVIWHMFWANLFQFFSIPNSEIFFRAKIIHVSQTYIAFFSVFLFSHVAIRNIFKQIDKTILNYLSLWSVIIWFSIFATFSVQYQLVWNLWYSVNYQITLPLFWYITALTLILALEETSIQKKIFFVIQILVISRIILQIHSMEFLYYLMYLFVFGLIYLDKVYFFFKKYYYLAIPIGIGMIYIAKMYQPEKSKFFNYLELNKLPSLYHNIVSQGHTLVGGFNRSAAAINELMEVILYLGVLVTLIVVKKRLLNETQFIDFRKFSFIIITSMFVLIPLYVFSSGLFSIITRINVIHRIYYSSSIYILLPVFVYYLWYLKDHKNISIAKTNLTLLLLLSSVWLYSKYYTPNQIYYKNVKSIKNSFFERRVGFHLSEQQIDIIGQKLEAYKNENKSNKEIFYYARHDVAFVIKYIYHGDVYWQNIRSRLTYKDFEWYINKQVIDKTRLDHLASYLELKKNTTIILSIKGEGSRRLSVETRKYLTELGIDIGTLKNRGSFIAVLSNGKLIDYKIDNRKKVLLSSKKLKVLGIDHVSSAGYKTGNLSEIVINGKDYSKNHRGINIVVICNDNKITSTYADTYLADHVGNNIPTKGKFRDAKEIVLFELPSEFPDYEPFK